MREKKHVNEKSITVKMDAALAESIDDMKWKMKTDRTSQIIKAREFYVSAITCPKCSTLNDRKTNYCSVCLEPLSETAKERKRMTGLLDAIVMNDARYQKVLEVITPHRSLAGVLGFKSGSSHSGDKFGNI